MPSPHPSQNPSARARQSWKRGNTMSVYKYIHYINSRAGPMSNWISNSYAVSNDSDALICFYRRGEDLLPWWHFTNHSIRNALNEQEQKNVSLSHTRNYQFSVLYSEFAQSPFLNQKNRIYRKYCLLAHTTAAFFMMCISSQQQIQTQTLRNEQNAVEFCQVRNAAVCLISHLGIVWMETGTAICRAARL